MRFDLLLELERTRALEAHIVQLQQLNQKIQQWNLMMPLRDKQYPLHNLDDSDHLFSQAVSRTLILLYYDETVKSKELCEPKACA